MKRFIHMTPPLEWLDQTSYNQALASDLLHQSSDFSKIAEGEGMRILGAVDVAVFAHRRAYQCDSFILDGEFVTPPGRLQISEMKISVLILHFMSGKTHRQGSVSHGECAAVGARAHLVHNYCTVNISANNIQQNHEGFSIKARYFGRPGCEIEK